MSEKQPMPIWKIIMIPVLMFGFGYLMVPIYDVLCDVTGLNGKTGAISSESAAASQVDETREIKVIFVSSVNQQGAWEFKPKQSSMMVNPGKTYSTTFVAKNTSNTPAISQSIPSVSPNQAAAHFDKTECFCFTEQKFAARETREMPLTFIVGNQVPKDVDTITLSYTLFTKQTLSSN